MDGSLECNEKLSKYKSSDNLQKQVWKCVDIILVLVKVVS